MLLLIMRRRGKFIGVAHVAISHQHPPPMVRKARAEIEGGLYHVVIHRQ
ncbi:MAG: hypothetical protein WAM70_18270 [Pyrinomonadaceae bacterium]